MLGWGGCGPKCEIGREVCIGTPEEVIEESLLIGAFAREVLALRFASFVIYMGNKKHISALQKEGIEPIGTTYRGENLALVYRISLTDDSISRKKRYLLERLTGKTIKYF